MRRRKAREYSLQLLYMLDALGPNSFQKCQPADLVALHKHLYQPINTDIAVDEVFWQQLVQTTAQQIEQIDTLIESRSQHWKLQRMSRVDRSILRLATAELLAIKDIPVSVTIDEAVELAKRYGTEDSPAFVNGVLDSLWKSISTEYPKPIS